MCIRDRDERLSERLESLVAERAQIRRDLLDEVDVQVGSVNSDLANLQERLEESDGLLAKLSPAVDELSSREVVTPDQYATLLALAEELESAVGQSRVLADEALARTDSVEAAGVRRHDDLVAKLAAVETDLNDRSDAVAANVGGLDERLSERLESLVAEREQIRRDLLDELDVQVGSVNSDLTFLQERLDESDGVLAKLSPAVDDLVGREVVTPEEYESLVALAQELELAVGQSRVLADEALTRTDSIEAASAKRHDKLVKKLASVEGDLATRSDEALSRADSMDERLSERVEALVAEREQIRRDLVKDVDIRVGGLSKEHTKLRERLETTDSLMGELGPAIEEISRRKVVSQDDYEALLSLVGEFDHSIEQARLYADEALARTESFDHVQDHLSKRVEWLWAEREQIREDLLNDVDIRVGGLSKEHAKLRKHLEETDSLLAKLSPAVDGLVGKDPVAGEVVSVADYEELAALTAELERLVADSREMADEALARTSVVEADVRNQTTSVIEAAAQNRRIGAQLDGVQAAIAALRSGSSITEEQLAELREVIKISAEDADGIWSAIEESQEMSIKAADKAESAADHVDGLRADHDSEAESNKARNQYLIEQLERIDSIEEREGYERNRQRRIVDRQDDEFAKLVERLAEVERALEEQQSEPSQDVQEEAVIDLRPEHAPPTWQFERRRTPRTPPAEKS